jgi:hypothetical protein
MMMKITIIGIREENGMLLCAATPSADTLHASLAFINSKFTTDDSVRALVTETAKNSKKDLSSLPELNDLRFYSIHKLNNYLERCKERVEVKYILIWTKGEWTCCQPQNGVIVPFRTQKILDGEKDVSKLAFSTELRGGWFESYFPFAFDPPTPGYKPKRKRILSKEDWLKQNYPELKELPKWRFPG